MNIPSIIEKAEKEEGQNQMLPTSAPCWLTNPLHRIAARLRF
jgi:hypothetical protein